jgi:hypothetical protein
MTIREALLSLGYSEQKSGYWLKPIGFHCLCFKEATNQWTNVFTTVDDGKLAVWESHDLKPDTKEHGSYSFQLKYFECFTRTDVYCWKSQFEISAIDL